MASKIVIDRELLELFRTCQRCDNSKPCDGCLTLALCKLKKGGLTEEEAIAYVKELEVNP